MTRLDLDDPRWTQLETRSTPDRPVVEVLRHLISRPDDLDVLQEFWPYLCSEDTPWSAAYAAVPYMMDAAEQSGPAARLEYLIFFGYLRECTDERRIPSDLRAEYTEAMARALTLFNSSWASLEYDRGILPDVVASFVALRGEARLASLIRSAEFRCPQCGADLL